MLGRLPLRNLWRILRETDLEAIRRGAESRFEVLIAGDDEADAQQLASLIGDTGDAEAVPAEGSRRHPWLVVTNPSAATPLLGRDPFSLAVLVSRRAELSSSLGSIRDDQAARGVPIIVVVIGDPAKSAAIVRRGEGQRVTVPDLDAPALEAVGKALLSVTPAGLRLGLGRQLPALRTLIFVDLIDETAKANASYAFASGLAEIIPVVNIPMNIGDVVILTKNQLVMSYKIALVAGKSGTPRDLIGEILGVLGGGLLFRQMARQLVGLIPVAGVAPKVAVAYGGTWAIGKAVVLWATAGQVLTRESVGQFLDEGLKRGRKAARALVPRRRRGNDRRERLASEAAPHTDERERKAPRR